MDENDDILSNLWVFISDIKHPENWLQIGILAVSLGLAFLIAHFIGKFLFEQTVELDTRNFKRITFRSLKRILFPLTALIVVLISRGILQRYEQPVQLLNFAVPLLLSLGGIRLLIYILRKAFKPSPLLKAWENIISISVWIIVALYLLDLLPAVRKSLQSIGFKIGSSQFTLLSIVESVVYIAIFFTVALWISATLERRLRSSTVINASIKVALAKFFKFLVLTFALLIGLDIAGIDLTALTVFGGALGVGIGFGLQRITSNFISGFLLVFDKSIKPGDTISIGDKFGWVEELRARYIVVRDRDGVDTLIPNENLITSDVINWSYTDANVRVKLPISISYHDDPELAMKLMLEAAKETNRVLSEPPPAARLMAFGDNGIELELRLWINDPQQGLNNVRSEANLNMWRKFKDAGITIPFPQRDVYVKHLAEQTKGQA
jgi:small-conductance mechanosensitive channel